MHQICPKCMAYMLQHRENHLFLKCPSCGYCQKEFRVSITKDELLKNREKQYPEDYTQEVNDNLDKLLIALNKIRDAYSRPMIVSSGWRPSVINSTIKGAAKKSKHMSGLAADFVDVDGRLMNWVLQNLQLMQDLGIYLENFNYTNGWVHMQMGGPTSGKRIFIPNTDPASRNVWDNKYDSKFDDKI